MIAKQGRFVEYSVFGQETSVDWTIISDAKGRVALRKENTSRIQTQGLLITSQTL